MKLSTMTKDEKSLLLFLETCAVDRGGRVDTRRMNSTDRNIVDGWTILQFVRFGRICYADLSPDSDTSDWVHLSEEAFRLAHEERKARAERMWDKRSWRTTEEFRDTRA